MVTTTRHGATFTVRVRPGAKRTALLGIHQDPQSGEAYKIALHSPPVDGKANAALLEFLARLLNTPRSTLTILSGATSRTKRIACTSLPASEVEQKLADAIPVA
jgi:uncharacterized protein (TIGR00251 family)